jgi:hypothetical protein
VAGGGSATRATTIVRRGNAAEGPDVGSAHATPKLAQSGHTMQSAA